MPDLTTLSAPAREHRAVLPGKTTTPEFGWKGVTDSQRGGRRLGPGPAVGSVAA